MNVSNRTIFEGDNLAILRGIDSEVVDLIYLDPPFNSNRTYEAPIGSEAAGAAFKDAWTLSDVDNVWHGELAEEQPALYSAISAAGETHGKSMKAYLIMMSIRMLEMYRVLKPTGSIYLHCDDTAVHYLKTIMDGIFGSDNFRNQILWQRTVTTKGNLTRGLARDSDFILRYSKSKDFVWNSDAVTIPYDLSNLDEKTKKQYKHIEEGTGRRVSYTALNAPKDDPNSTNTYEIMGVTRTWRWTKERMLREIQAGRVVQTRPGNVPRYKRYLDEQKGKMLNNVWIDIPNPFCGCATTCVAAESLQRKWIGIDISPKAIELLKLRLKRLLNLTEDTGILGQVIHETIPPQRTDLVEPRQIHFEGLFGIKDSSMRSKLSERDLWRFKTHKHVLFGMQEGRCAGCQYLFHFRNMTIDHIYPRSTGGSDELQNLQLLCGSCNSTKGDRTQEYLIDKLKEDGILR